MIRSEQVRAIRKHQQTNRLAAKSLAAESGDYDVYAKFYTSQSLQVAKAEHNDKITRARELVLSTAAAVEVADATGVDIPTMRTTANTARVTLVALQQEKQTLFGKATSFGLSGGDV